MRIGAVITLGFGPHGKPGLLPTIGYALGASIPSTIAARGTDEAEYPDYRKLRRMREERDIMQVVREFLRIVH